MPIMITEKDEQKSCSKLWWVWK